MRHIQFLRTVGVAALIACLAVPGAAFAQQDETEFNPATVNSFAGAVLAGRTAESDRDFDAAIAFYKKALRFEPDNTRIKQFLMVLLFKDGRFDDGVVLANDLKDDAGINAVARLSLGINAMRQREFSSARTQFDFDSVSSLDKILFTLLDAWALVGEGDREMALAQIDELQGEDWYPIFKNFQSAAIEELGGNREKARELYTSLILDQDVAGLAPETYVRAAMALATMEANAGNKRSALDAISSAGAFASGYAPLNALRERIEADNPPPPDIANVEQGAASVLYSLGSALYRDRADDIVSLYLNFANALDPNNAANLVMLGDLAANTGDIERAIEIYESVREDSVMHRVAELQLGLNLADLDRHDEAKSYLRQLIKDDPQDVRSYLAYGSVLSDTKEYREMADNYDRAVKVIGALPNRSHWNVFFQRGIAYERLNEWEKAEPSFKKALELSPNQPQVMNYLGYSWVDMNINLDEGMELIRDAVRLRPNDGYIVDSLGWAYYRLGDYDNAVEELERAVELRPGDPTINDHLGDAYWRAGRKTEAVYQWKRALTMESEDLDISNIETKIAEGLPDEVKHSPAATKTDQTRNGDELAPPDPTVEKESKAGQGQPENEAQYTVKPGQTLWNIAVEVLGDGNLYGRILDANPGLNGRPDMIHPGQVINLP